MVDGDPLMASIRIGLTFAHSGYRFCTQRLMLVSCAQCLALVSQARDARLGSVFEPSVRQMVQGSAALGEEGLRHS